MRTRILLAAAASALVFASSASAVVVYSATTETGTRANPGADTAFFDDVFLTNSNTLGAYALEVTKITVGVRRLANAPATDVTFYYTSNTDDGVAPNLETFVTPVSTIGTTSLAVNGGSSLTQLVTQGDGVTPLFTVPLDTTEDANDGMFYIGLSLSNANGNSGWRVVSDANSFDAFHVVTLSTQTNEGIYSFGDPTNSPGNFYTIVEGNLQVPEPASASLIGLAGMAMIRRRRA